MCNNQVPIIFSCMQGACNARDQATTLKFAQELCDQANVTSTAGLSGAKNPAATTLSLGVSTAADSADATLSLPPSSSAVSSKSGLSTGATAGIGVGAVLGVLAVAAGGFFLWRRKRGREGEEVSGSAMRYEEPKYTLPPEYGQKGHGGVHIIHHEVEGVQWTELEAKEASRHIR